MRRRPPNLEELTAECARFNAAVPVGSAVIVTMDNGEQRETVTQTGAQILSGHTAVIWLEGITGCYLLSRVLPKGDPPEPKPCGGGVPGQTAVAFPDTFQPCPAPAVWICNETEARYCGAHRQEIELIDHQVSFRPIARLSTVRSPRAYAWIAAAIGNLSLAVSEFADEGHTQHVTVGDAILDQLTELYKAVTK